MTNLTLIRHILDQGHYAVVEMQENEKILFFLFVAHNYDNKFLYRYCRVLTTTKYGKVSEDDIVSVTPIPRLYPELKVGDRVTVIDCEEVREWAKTMNLTDSHLSEIGRSDHSVKDCDGGMVWIGTHNTAYIFPRWAVMKDYGEQENADMTDSLAYALRTEDLLAELERRGITVPALSLATY